MAYISQVEEGDAEGRLKRVYDAAIGRTGHVPKIIKVQSLDAPSLDGMMAFYLNTMKRENALPAAKREMLATVVSVVNDCYY